MIGEYWEQGRRAELGKVRGAKEMEGTSRTIASSAPLQSPATFHSLPPLKVAPVARPFKKTTIGVHWPDPIASVSLSYRVSADRRST